MIYEMLNCSFIDGCDNLPDAQDGDIFLLCKMAQKELTVLYPNKKIIILGGNWTNIKEQPEWEKAFDPIFPVVDFDEIEKIDEHLVHDDFDEENIPLYMRVLE